MTAFGILKSKNPALREFRHPPSFVENRLRSWLLMNLRLLHEELVKPLPGCRSLDYDAAPESTGHGCDRPLPP
jgi:hypothetical protein